MKTASTKKRNADLFSGSPFAREDMEITTTKQPAGWLELRIAGRLDNYWADHFKSALDELIRAGNHKIRLELASVDYLSSAGIGALIRCHKQLETIRGKLVVASCSEAVQEVLHIARLEALLTTEGPAAPNRWATTVALGKRQARPGVNFEVFGARAEPIVCRLIGAPDRWVECCIGADDCRTMQFPASVLGIGLGALGKDFSDCQGRLGEFLAVAGAAAYLPTDGTNVADYLVATGDQGPELQVCYGLACEGALTGFARFEADEETGRVSFSSLVRGCLDLAKTDRIGLVLVGESAGLIGAALRRSPAGGGDVPAPFAFPQVRDWLSFTAERAYKHATVLVAGVAQRGVPGPLEALVRPLGTDPALQGHFHAAAFSYRPLPRGEFMLRPAVTSLFEQQTLQGILHLLADNRPASGLGESAFVRGACWFGPIGDVVIGH
jgi:anti-anti-sigma factor